MKKLLSIALVLTLALSLCVPVFASEINQDSTLKSLDTTITTSIAPTYTVTIPANTEIKFEAESTRFGSIELTAAQIDPGHVVKVSAAAGSLTNKDDKTKTIPYVLNAGGSVFTAADYTKAGDQTALTLDITKDAWNAAYAGSYQGTITFTVEYTQQIKN